jgi:hypothetical protein
MREKVISSEIKLVYVKTAENIADIFTKILPTNIFTYLVAIMNDVYISKV